MGKFENTKKKKPSKNERIFVIYIEFSLVRQGGLEPTAFGSGGQLRPLCEHMFLLYLKPFLFSPGAIWVRKCLRKVS